MSLRFPAARFFPAIAHAPGILAGLLIWALAAPAAEPTAAPPVDRFDNVDLMVFAALKADPARAIAALRDQFPDEPKAEACIRLLESVGQPCDFSFTSLGGRTVNTRDYRGKVVLIEFWSRGCSGCLTALANLRRLGRTFSPRDLTILTVNLDTDRSAATDVVDRLDLPWPVAFDGQGFKGPLATRFLVDALPRGLLVDRQSRLRQRSVSPFNTKAAPGILALIAER